MLRGVRLDRETLQTRYALSVRAVVRVGALLSRGVEITAAVLEQARPGSPTEGLLLAPEWVRGEAPVTKETLERARQRLSPEHRAETDAITLVESGEVRVVALEEESLAEIGFASAGAAPGEAKPQTPSPPPERPGPLSLDFSRGLPHILRPEEAVGLFTPEEIGRLKLRLLSGVNAPEKIEALRRLTLAPIPAEEKGVLLLKAVVDDDPGVRKEAAQALRSLGMSADIAEAVGRLSEGDSRQKRLALGRLQKLLQGVSEGEQAVLLAVLLADFRTQSDLAVLRPTIDAIGLFAPVFARRPEFLQDLTRRVAEHLAVHFDALYESVLGLFRALAAEAPHAIIDPLWREMEQIRDRRLRAYLLLLLVPLPLKTGRKSELATLMVETVAGWDDAVIDCRRLSNGLKPLGEPAVQALIRKIPEAPEGQRVFLVRLLDDAAHAPSIPPRTAGRGADMLLDLLRTAKRPLRLAILECRLCHHPAVSEPVRRRFAEAIVSGIHEYHLSTAYTLLELALRRLGRAALEPTFSVAKSSPWPGEREVALRLLGDLLHDAPADDAVAKKCAAQAVGMCRTIVEEGGPLRQPAATTLGKLCGGRAVEPETVRRIGEEALSRLGKVSSSYELVEILRWIAGGGRTPIDLRMRLGMVFIDLIGMPFPENIGRERRTKDGTVLEIGAGTEAYTVFLPSLIAGLGALVVAEDVSPTYREKVIDTLLGKWNDLMQAKIVWGPANTVSIAEVFGAVGRSACTPIYLKRRVIEALRERIVNMPIVRVLGEVFEFEEDSAGLNDLCASITAELLKMTAEPDYQESEDQAVLCGALGRIAGRKALANEKKESEALRSEIVRHLCDSARENLPEARTALERLEKSAHLPKALRKMVTERIEKK
ncbi:MAG: hypothetical protein HYY93_09240 [Planctomycetes bacterium]|nr:hypothetical protein [Planctomycetota bacterium]